MLFTLDAILNEKKYGLDLEDDCFGNEMRALDGDYVVPLDEEDKAVEDYDVSE